MKRFLPLVLLLAFSLDLEAQTLSNYERWLMNDRLADLLDNYESFSRFSRSSDEESFYDLFIDSDVSVYCDFVSSNSFDKQVSVSKYIDISSRYKEHTVIIANLKKDNYSFKDGAWHIRVSFDKIVGYKDKAGTTFRKKTVGGDYRIEMSCVWNPKKDCFLIEDISGIKPAGFSFPSDFAVVRKKNEVDEKVLYDNQSLAFDDMWLAVIQDGKQFSIKDDNYLLKVIREETVERYNLYTFDIRQTPMRARMRLSFSPFGAYRVVSSYDNLSTSSFGAEASVDFGYSINVASASKLVFYTGAGLSLGSINMSAGNVDYEYSVYDKSGKQTIRDYHLESVTEGVRLTDFVIPAYLSFEQGLGSGLALVADAGVKVYLNLNSTTVPYHVKGTVTSNGDTEEFDSDYYQFVSPNIMPVNQFSVSAFGKAGIEYAILQGLYANLHLGYEYGLTESYSSVASMVKWYDENGIFPMIYYGESDVPLHSFLSSITYRRNAILLELGLRYKF